MMDRSSVSAPLPPAKAEKIFVGDAREITRLAYEYFSYESSFEVIIGAGVVVPKATDASKVYCGDPTGPAKTARARVFEVQATDT